LLNRPFEEIKKEGTSPGIRPLLAFRGDRTGPEFTGDAIDVGKSEK